MKSPADFDYRDLRTVRQIIDDSRPSPDREPTLREGTLRDWIFYSADYDFERCVLRIGRRVYVHLPTFNAWLAARLGRST
jgi:hypothetical protein